MNIVCSSCYATNRVPNARLAEDPKCGKCSQPIFGGAPVELSPDFFQRFITNNELPVVVDFWAPWCGPCKIMAPVFATVGAEFKIKARFAKVNTEEHQTLSGSYQIRSIPTLVFFQAGNEVDRISGALDANSLRAWISQRL